MAESDDTRCGFVALIGAPNAGKSTLINALVGAKVSIVSRKVQTTRALVRGIAIVGTAQLVLVDTPGIFAPKRRLDRAMVTTAWGGARDADIVALLIDAKKGLDEEADAILGKLADVRQPKVLVLNKVDIVDKPALLTLAQTIGAKAHVRRDLHAVGADRRRRRRSEATGSPTHSPAGPWHYPEDQISDAPMRALAAEITREKLFDRLHQELPYQSTVETESWKELRGGACASSRRSMWSARASARSCSARAARPSRRSAPRRARRSPR